jgi:PLP dependent protein
MAGMSSSVPPVPVPPEPAIADRLGAVLDRIARAAEAADRDPAGVRLLLATKTRTPAEIATALDAVAARGLRPLIGENRAQEIAKHADPLLADRDYDRHFIGALQTNKAKDVVGWAQVVHSVDREGLLTTLERRCALADVRLRVLLEVNTSGEGSKSGYAPEPAVLADAVRAVAEAPHLDLGGLMTIGANVADPEQARASLRRLRELRDSLRADLGTGPSEPAAGLEELSMGMSRDLEVAIAEGATLVRVGTGVFGARD